MSERLAQGSYVAAKGGVESMTLRTKGVDSSKAPPRPAIAMVRPVILYRAEAKTVMTVEERKELQERTEMRMLRLLT